jgi:hypothetical protein
LITCMCGYEFYVQDNKGGKLVPCPVCGRQAIRPSETEPAPSKSVRSQPHEKSTHLKVAEPSPPDLDIPPDIVKTPYWNLADLSPVGFLVMLITIPTMFGMAALFFWICSVVGLVPERFNAAGGFPLRRTVGAIVVSLGLAVAIFFALWFFGIWNAVLKRLGVRLHRRRGELKVVPIIFGFALLLWAVVLSSLFQKEVVKNGDSWALVCVVMGPLLLAGPLLIIQSIRSVREERRQQSCDGQREKGDIVD